MMKRMDDDEEDLSSILAQHSNIRDKVWEQSLQQKQLLITEVITDSLIEKVVLQIFNINAYDDSQEAQIKDYVRDPITIYINSPGGNIDEAFAIISAIKSSKTPVHTVALGKAYSAGFMILLAGHERYAQLYTELMYHQGAAGYVGKFADIKEHAEYCDRIQEKIEKYVIKYTKIKSKTIKDVFTQKKDWFMTSEEALELGVIDGII